MQWDYGRLLPTFHSQLQVPVIIYGDKGPMTDSANVDSNLSIWSVWVPEDRLVLRFKAGLKKAIPWLSASSAPGKIECGAIVGKDGQIVLRPASEMPEAWRLVASSLKKTPPSFGEERTTWFELARLVEASKLVSITLESEGRISVYLSTVLADANIGPKRNAYAIAAVAGNVLELWDRDAWASMLRRSGERLSLIETQSIEPIRSRDE